MRSDSSSGDDSGSINDRDRQKLVQAALIWRGEEGSATNADGNKDWNVGQLSLIF